jgi:hypothetical protein
MMVLQAGVRGRGVGPAADAQRDHCRHYDVQQAGTVGWLWADHRVGRACYGGMVNRPIPSEASWKKNSIALLGDDLRIVDG